MPIVSLRTSKETDSRDTAQRLLLSLIAIVLVTTVSVIRWRIDDINFKNSDATWHTLLTIQAYDETPISEHLFLPLVSLGSPDDKGIPWGATLPDEEGHGNYYYTSFSPAGFFAPWLFMKLFHLPSSIESLYLFNCVLFVTSSILWCSFIFSVFRASRYRFAIALIGLSTYVLSPELLHGMGLVYWHQSLMQVTLILQIMCYWKMRLSNSPCTSAVIGFYALCLLNPYIEWTGYVANLGFALSEALFYWRSNRARSITQPIKIIALTILCMPLFILHYTMRIETGLLLKTMADRFLERSESRGGGSHSGMYSDPKSFLSSISGCSSLYSGRSA